MNRVSLLAVLVLAMAVTACGRKGPLEPPPAPPATQNQAG